MARFYVIALRNELLSTIAPTIGAKTAHELHSQLDFLPKLSESERKQIEKDEALIGEKIAIVENSKALLEDVCTRIDEAVEVEGNERELFLMLAEERRRAVEIFQDIHTTRQAYCWHILPTVLKPNLISKPFLIPIIKGFITPPIGWTDADTMNDPRPKAAIVCITRAEFSELSLHTKAHIARAIRAAKNNPDETILKRLVETAQTLSEMQQGEPAAGNDEAPAPAAADAADATATDTAETVEAEPGAGALAYPDGLEVIEENKGGALDAGFLKEVLPNVQYIHGQETDRPERWEHPCQITHRERHPWTVFEWKGIRYRAWKEEYPKKRYAVKLGIQEPGTPTNRVFDFINER